MTYDPLSEVLDEPLNIDAATIKELIVFRAATKLQNLPGLDTLVERNRLTKVLNDLIDALVAGVQQNPTKLWVMAQFQKSLQLVEQEDTEAREHFGTEVENIMDILCIESSDGLLSCYLGGM